MNAAFTIVAKNYFAFALTLAQSINKNNPGLEFYILLADEIEDGNMKEFEGPNHKLILSKDLNINNYKILTFKYNITEFCTAIKPFFFSWLFEEYNYEKVVYFDPDIYIYKSLNSIYSSLDNHSALITPHFITPQVNYTGNSSETLTLFAGIYNLGFIALKNCAEGIALLKWWEKRLYDLCYADKFEALHVDQKWIDFIPALFKDVKISRNLGYNIAYWNIHEREIFKNNDGYTVKNRITRAEEDELTFLHFSGLDPIDVYHNKQCPTIDINNYPDWVNFIKQYAEEVIANNFKVYLNYKYSYAHFENGSKISQFQRRLFRRIYDYDFQKFDNPYSTTFDSFYYLLKANALLLNDNSTIDKMNERNFQDFDKKLKILNRVMILIKKIVGFEKYTLLLKFCQRYFRPENQTFLIKQLNNQIPFKNENIYN